MTASLSRPRYRSSSFLTVGAEIERLSYRQRGVTLTDPFFGDTHLRPSVLLSAGWSNAARPALAISPEDGISLGLSARRGWLRGGEPASSATIIGTARGFKSLDLPGFAHHVLALRLAGGWMDSDRVTSPLGIGGTNGTSLDVLPGVPLGESQRTFAVRGFSPSSIRATEGAAAASLEYRAPLVAPSRGLGLLPFFLDRLSLAAFVDAGTGWCRERRGCFYRDVGFAEDGTALLSGGLELVADFALQYDVPARARLGVAQPLRTDVGLAMTRDPSIYFTFGPSF